MFCKICFRIADSYPVLMDGKSIYFRERNRFIYKPILLEKFTLDELHSKIDLAFKDHHPAWEHGRRHAGYPSNSKLKIYRIIKPGSFVSVLIL
jgi:hypothetical protein